MLWMSFGVPCLCSPELKPQVSHLKSVNSLSCRVTTRGKCNVMCTAPGTKAGCADDKPQGSGTASPGETGLGRVQFALAAGEAAYQAEGTA